MRKTIGITALVVFFSSHLLAETGDTSVFRVRLLPENEVPAVSLSGASADATITVRVSRDGRGSIDAATVIFEVDYVMPITTTSACPHGRQRCAPRCRAPREPHAPWQAA